MPLNSLRVSNLLSFGPDSGEIPLGPLNVLIGPNGSGKSNLLEIIGLLKAAASDGLPKALRQGGGIREWLWKGASEPRATIETQVGSIRHQLSLEAVGQGFEIADERVESFPARGVSRPTLQFGYRKGRPMLRRQGALRELDRRSLDPTQSVVGRYDDWELYPHIAELSSIYRRLLIYGDWRFGIGSPPRTPQPADLPELWLLEDASNLGLVLNALRRNAATKQALLEQLKLLAEGVTDVDVSLSGGTVQVFLQEGDWTIPAARLSEGTLRWLALIAILVGSGGRELICIEEPEIGLHPDLLPALAALLKKASEHVQLVVTTHSDVLVDALTDEPESVLVCEKRSGSTHLRRLSRRSLKTWLDKYRLGELWRSGQLGGNRW